MTVIVTGGAGFIGSNFVLDWLGQSDESIVDLDALTYAGNLHKLDSLRGNAKHVLVQGDICDRPLLKAGKFIATLERRQVLKMACPKEIAWRSGWIDAARLESLAQPLLKNGFGQYLLKVLYERAV